MTVLSNAIQQYLLQDTELTALLGKSSNWQDGWIFYDDIYVRLEQSQRVAVVITENGNYAAPNPHNTMRFPRVYVDIWADPTRNSDGSVKVQDAKDKIEEVHKFIFRHLHTVDPGGSQTIRIWGTAAAITNKTGVVVNGSRLLTGPDFNPIADGDGAFMGRYVYGVDVVS